MPRPHSKPLEEMTEAEVRAWKKSLLDEGMRPRPFASGRVSHTQADPVSEPEYEYEPALNRVIERSSDGKRYIVGVRNAKLQRLQELNDEEKSGLVPGLRKLRSG